MSEGAPKLVRNRRREHGRQRILHFSVTRHPSAAWVVQQLREVFPEAAPYRYVILDRDSKFDDEAIKFGQGALMHDSAD